MVLEGLMKAELSVSSVSTLKRICRECKYDLGSHAHDILSVSQVRFTPSISPSARQPGLTRRHFPLQDALAKEVHKVSRRQLRW